MATMPGAIAAFEREIMLESQREGVAGAKKGSSKAGGPQPEWRAEVRQLSLRASARLPSGSGIHRASVHLHKKRRASG
jgi:DNA invertase Pin-like site-specific DNA recombinase